MDPVAIGLKLQVLDESTAAQVQEKIAAGTPEETALLEAGLDEATVKNIFAEYFLVPTEDVPQDVVITQEVLDYIPEESAVHYHIVPLRLEDGVLLVGTNDPDNLQMREALNFISSKHNVPYKLIYLLSSEVTHMQTAYANLKGDVGDALETLTGDLDKEIAASLESSEDEQKDEMEHIKEDAPVTKIVATILRYAVDGGASDIHIEPDRAKVSVRFRVDGDLAKSLELPKNVHMAVVARVKILSSMRLDERRKPQDGRFSATFDSRKIDFRVSVLPTNHGEKVVMRILDNEQGVRNIADTGITEHNLMTIKQMLKIPHGIILISGPTGSGKSTTLYGMLGEVDRLSKNVLSLEDPVEYNIAGVSQSQVRPEIGYTFAHGLRAALRQDPDIIMVGEIRDKETAQLAIQAALTGHLVLSTIHTNNAIGVIPRLIDMGIDPYLIAPTLRLAIAQRLARTLCDGSGVEEEIPVSLQHMIDKSFNNLPKRFRDRIPQGNTILHPEPAPGCPTGLRGRTAVTEVLTVTEEMQELILRNASEEEFYDEARRNGFISMQEDAIIKALNHQIPYEEMNAFTTKLATETIEDELVEPIETPETPETAESDDTVDNKVKPTADPAIMNTDENTVSGR